MRRSKLVIPVLLTLFGTAPALAGTQALSGSGHHDGRGGHGGGFRGGWGYRDGNLGAPLDRTPPTAPNSLARTPPGCVSRARGRADEPAST